MMPHRLLAQYMPEIFSAATGTTVAVYAQVSDPQSGVPTTIGIGTVCGILLWTFIRRTDADQKMIVGLVDEKKKMFESAIEVQKQYTQTMVAAQKQYADTMVESQRQHTEAMVALTNKIMATEAAQQRLLDGMLAGQNEIRDLLSKVIETHHLLSQDGQREGGN